MAFGFWTDATSEINTQPPTKKGKGRGRGRGNPGPGRGGGPKKGSAPVNTALPAITGNFYTGETLSVSDGTWTGEDTITYQWTRGGADISGATSNTYVLVSADEGNVIDCDVTASNSDGDTTVSATGENTAAAMPASVIHTQGGGWSGATNCGNVTYGSNKRIIVLVVWERDTSTRDVTGVTLGATALTKRVEALAGNQFVNGEVWTTSKTTGATETLTVTWSGTGGGVSSRLVMVVEADDSLFNAAPNYTDSRNTTTGAVLTDSVPYTDAGFIIAGGVSISGASDTMSGITTQATHTDSSGSERVGFDVKFGTGNQSVSYDPTSTSDAAAVYAAWDRI